MKTISIDEIRVALATDDAEGLDGLCLFDIMLDGAIGYNNISDEDCLEYYINKESFYECGSNCEEPTKIAVVLGKDGKPKFDIIQECQDIGYKLINPE